MGLFHLFIFQSMTTSKFDKLYLMVRAFGFLLGLKSVIKLFLAKKGELVRLNVPGVAHPIYLRAGTSDEYAFQQIFLVSEYKWRYNIEPKSILDGGANIGLAAVYFATIFPEAEITCVEPQEDNFRILEMNIRGYSRIKAVQAAVWKDTGFIKVVNEGLGNWGFVVKEAKCGEEGALLGRSVESLSTESRCGYFDFVKLDIEGSERYVFDQLGADSWLSLCKILVLELHDRMMPGTSRVFFNKLLAQRSFEFDVKGENLYIRFLE
jgi:FkbM family methyltransferase